MTSHGIRKALDSARDELADLLEDQPKVRKLHEEHQRRLAQATTSARSGETPLSELSQVRSEAESVAGMLAQLQAAIAETRERVANLETEHDSLERQDRIDELADATEQLVQDWHATGRNLTAVIMSSLEELARIERQVRSNAHEARNLEGDVPAALRYPGDLRLGSVILGPDGLPATVETRAAVEALETLKRRTQRIAA